jgi:hypothetical protein
MSGILNVPATINDAAYQRQNPHTYNTFKDIDIE